MSCETYDEFMPEPRYTCEYCGCSEILEDMESKHECRECAMHNAKAEFQKMCDETLEGQARKLNACFFLLGILQSRALSGYIFEEPKDYRSVVEMVHEYIKTKKID